MFSIFDRVKGSKYCDGISRRNFLKLGAYSTGGLTLGQLLQAEEAAGIGSSQKSIINIHLGGGPSHQDTFDLKPDAASEFRGEFYPTKTNIAGMDICEHMPMLAKNADKFAIVRSMTGTIADHSDHHTQTGFDRKSLVAIGGRPSIGSVISHLQGSTGGAPPFVGYNGSYPGYLGSVHKPYKPQGGDLRLNSTMTADRLTSRTQLLQSLDCFRRDTDNARQMEALDAYTQRAVEIVTSGSVADALDTGKEDPKIVERYGKGGESFLRARRLVETGVRVVGFNWGGWDTHSNNFNTLRGQLPRLDRHLSALLEDLYQRGLDKDVSVVMWGEFGRTPRVNNNKGGRDHWYGVSMCVLAGGGMKTGQVIGSSTKNAEQPQDRPVHMQQVFATLYHNMGIDVATTTINDPSGRPQYLVDHRAPIHELI